MKFNRYIKEDLNLYHPERLKEMLKQVDKKILLMCLKKKKFFFRGQSQSDVFSIVKKKDYRKPKDTPEDVQIHIDNWFKKKFGWKVRSEGVFCTSNHYHAKTFGSPNYFFPIGEYKYVWSPYVVDLYNSLDLFYNEWYTKARIDILGLIPYFNLRSIKKDNGSTPEDYLKKLDSFMETLGFTNKSFDEIWNTSLAKEIVFNCKKFLLIDCGDFSQDELINILEEIMII